LILKPCAKFFFNQNIAVVLYIGSVLLLYKLKIMLIGWEISKVDLLKFLIFPSFDNHLQVSKKHFQQDCCQEAQDAPWLLELMLPEQPFSSCVLSSLGNLGGKFGQNLAPNFLFLIEVCYSISL
jgi:hypothetical protein